METSSTDRVLTFRPVRYTDILDASNAKELLAEYAEECSIPALGEANPQREIYERMEASGLMRSLGVFDGDVLVGFATLLIFVLPHYGKKIANVESLFVAESHRALVGKKLLSFLEIAAKAEQCTAMLYNARSGSRLERLLSALPFYQRTNSVFLRSLCG